MTAKDPLKNVDPALDLAYWRWMEKPNQQRYEAVMTELRRLQDEKLATAFYRKVVERFPEGPESRRRLAELLLEQNLHEECTIHMEAMILCAQKLGLLNKYLESYLAYVAHLGQWRKCWQLYRQQRGRISEEIPPLPWPLWPGGSIEGLKDKSVAVTTVQGYGDNIMMARYIPALMAAGADVTVYCFPPLLALFRRSFPLIEVSDKVPAEAEHDYMIPLYELLWMLDIGQDSVIPAKTAYLTGNGCPQPFDPKRRLQVGLCWGGNMNQANDWNRSILDIEVLRPLVAREDCHFVSLMVGPRAAEAEVLGISPMPESHNYADTADVIAGLDLVISVDTSVAHLAGALAKPVWIMLPVAREWRYHSEDPDRCHWYDSARIFWQPDYRNWKAVIARINAALDELPHG